MPPGGPLETRRLSNAPSASNAAIVSAIFDDHVGAQRAITHLRNEGVRDEALSFFARNDETHQDGGGNPMDRPHENSSGLAKGLIGGAALGGALGIVALAIPGVGPLAAAGAIATSAIPEAAVLGAGAGAILGGVRGLLKRHGVSESDAEYYERRLEEGGIFIAVDTESTSIGVDRIVDILYQHGGHNTMRPAAP